MGFTKVLKKIATMAEIQATVTPRDRRLKCQISQGYATTSGVLQVKTQVSGLV
jgi:hypothetical protein